MSNIDRDTRRDAISKTLANRAGGSAAALAIAEATIYTWRRFAGQLEPVIGARGVDVLFARALNLSAKTFSWLNTSGTETAQHRLRPWRPPWRNATPMLPHRRDFCC